MELFFNELSISLVQDEIQAKQKMEQFSDTVAYANIKGFTNIKSYLEQYAIQLANNYTLENWLNDKSVDRNFRDILYGMIITPFIQKEDENKYLEAEYFFENKEHNISKTECNGLAAAHLYESLSISLSSLSVWDSTKLAISIEQSGQTTSKNIFNVSSEKSFEDIEIADFVENMGEIVLIETPILPEDKKIHIADHGDDGQSEELSKRLKKSPYVLEIRSIHWGGSKFIRKYHKDGTIEVVLFKSTKKIAVLVQTTGRNLRETKEIANILDKKYS